MVRLLTDFFCFTRISSDSMVGHEGEFISSPYGLMTSERKENMKQYIIERFFPGAGKLTEKDLQAIADTSCEILRDMGPGIEWLNTFIMENCLNLHLCDLYCNCNCKLFD